MKGRTRESIHQDRTETYFLSRLQNTQHIKNIFLKTYIYCSKLKVNDDDDDEKEKGTSK